MRFARSEDLLEYSEPIILDTPENDDEFLKAVAKTTADLAQGETIKSILIGKPQWKRRPAIEEELARSFSAPVHFENDTALVGLGEAVYGAGKDAGIVAYLTISTGVNGVRIVNGCIDRSARGFEIGGQYVSTDGTVSWEEMISGRAIRSRFGVHPKDLGADHEIWEELAVIAAYGLHNTILHWSPDRVVIGGSMVNDIGISVPRIAMHVERIMRKFSSAPEIVHSKLGNVGGLWGGLARLRQINS